jgi:hypothetical protein
MGSGSLPGTPSAVGRQRDRQLPLRPGLGLQKHVIGEIQLDDNNRKPICRLYLNVARKVIVSSIATIAKKLA